MKRGKINRFLSTFALTKKRGHPVYIVKNYFRLYISLTINPFPPISVFATLITMGDKRKHFSRNTKERKKERSRALGIIFIFSGSIKWKEEPHHSQVRFNYGEYFSSCAGAAFVVSERTQLARITEMGLGTG